MTKADMTQIPPEWEALMAKIQRWYDSRIYPVFGPFFQHKTRRAKARNKAKTYLPSISTAWGLLNQVTKDAWHTASDFGTLNRYQLFVSDYSYRRKNNLSLPGTPNTFHQMMGLRMRGGPSPLAVVLRRDQKDLVGPITLTFNYKKIEFAPTGFLPFYVTYVLYYFEGGENKIESGGFVYPAGNIAWTTEEETFGVPGRKYFHLILNWRLWFYDAQVDLDRLLIEDANGDVYRESWQFKAGRTWEYDNLYRKEGWLFTPGYRVPYFDVVYLG